MKPSFITPILADLAREMGIEMHIEPRYRYVGQVRLPGGRTRYFRNAIFDLNGFGAAEIAKDKDYAAHFLALMGYPVPIGEAFHTSHWSKEIDSDLTPERAWEYAKRIGLPVIVKPNSKSQGSGVSLVRNKREFFSAVSRAGRNERVFLVQKQASGKDYRIVVLDGEVISVYERQPLRVTGDGASTIRDLLAAKQRYFIEIGRDTVLNADDMRITNALRRRKLTRESVLAKGESIALLPNANLSTGGDAVDVTPTVHPEWKVLAARIARDMNLRYIGIDVMTEHGLEQAPNEYVLIEVNAAPGLDNYASIGEGQMRIVRELYRKVLRALFV